MLWGNNLLFSYIRLEDLCLLCCGWLGCLFDDVHTPDAIHHL